MRDRRSIAGIALTLAIAGALTVAPGTAAAHTVRFDGRVTIRTNPDFHGRVISEKPRCERQRRVLIYREESGPDGLFARTRTGSDGRWQRLVTQLTGDFYAKIRRKDIGSGGHDHICRGDRSPSVHVQAPPP
jgi:hypothetical protein